MNHGEEPIHPLESIIPEHGIHHNTTSHDAEHSVFIPLARNNTPHFQHHDLGDGGDEENPMTEQDINPFYHRVKDVFVSLRKFTNLVFPDDRKHKFAPRLTRTELIQLQEYLGFTVPDEFVAIYSRHNGHDNTHPVQFVYDGEFLTTARIIEEVEKWREYSAGLNDETDSCRELPLDRIHGVKQQSWNDLWLPFAISADKNEFLCIDLDPNRALGGVSGQIICVSWYATPRYYVTKDIIYFFELLTEKLLHGDMILKSKSEEPQGLSYYCSIM